MIMELFKQSFHWPKRSLAKAWDITGFNLELFVIFVRVPPLLISPLINLKAEIVGKRPSLLFNPPPTPPLAPGGAGASARGGGV